MNNTSDRKATILIVDDAPDNLAVLNDMLHPDYAVRAATSGEKALQAAAMTPRPDLILLDIMMPGMDGYEVMQRLQASPATRDIPVIFVTALDSAEAEIRGLKGGAVDYITKPLIAPITLARIRTQLELKQARDRLQDQNAWLEAEVARRQQEAQQIQMQLLQGEKMAAIGQLAAGIAHEINNPVGFVSSNLGSLERYLQDMFEILDAYQPLDQADTATEEARALVAALKQQKELDYLRTDVRQLIDESRDGLSRVREIIQDLKSFSRRDDVADWQWADLHKGLESTLHIVWNELKYNCELHREYGELPQVYCMPSQLNQVFMNLLVNAAQAIEDHGDVTLRTGRQGETVWVEVSDTGKGISAENLKRIFEPFFTTKPVGKGTGLGLSLSLGIIEKHGGRMEVRSEPGLGSTFKVILPIGQPDMPAGETPHG
jgi:signal transduction histidine kinase